MSLTEETRRAVNERVSRLREEYGEFSVSGDTVELPREEFDAAREQARRSQAGSASACVLDGDRLLLVRTRESGELWGVPGTTTDGDESLEAAAVRAVREAVDVRCAVSGLHRVRRRRVVPVDGDDRAIHSLWTLFDARHESGSPRACGDAVTDVAWWESPPDAVHASVQFRVDSWANAAGPATR
ncbi:NUDIX domain-containing protein [Halostella litorea]|uniref:NUDIX domain-containing protein n=1 Tax=Halostella litorea TaxID=2528831 RepID=UPI001092B78E|nr:NUDIX domain-containing protein [Halostella litorea]